MNSDPTNPWPQPPAAPSSVPHPSVTAQSAWPPPPSSAAEVPVWRPFRFLYERLDGYISDLRDGAIAANSVGIYLSGRAQPRGEIFQPVVGLLFLLNVFLALVAYLILRYGFLQPVNQHIPWQSVRRVVSVTKRRAVCIVYDAPNYAGALKTFCFAFSLSPEDFEAFVAAAQQYAPDRTSEGKLKPGMSLVLRILLGVVLALVILITVILIGDSIHH